MIIVLDNIRSVLNVGSIFRTADAMGAELWLCGITPTPKLPRISKTALGAEHSVKWRYFENTVDAIATAKREFTKIKIVAVEQVTGAESLWDIKFSSSVALIFGHEREGVSAEAIEEADQLVEIPMFGKKESLNVAVAVGMVLYEVVRQQNNGDKSRVGFKN